MLESQEYPTFSHMHIPFLLYKFLDNVARRRRGKGNPNV